MGWKVIISPSARGDLADIVGYISRHNADASARIADTHGFKLATFDTGNKHPAAEAIA